jgi:hypothetical protein
MAGRSGYSATGSSCRVKRALPQVISRRESSEMQVDRLGRQAARDVGEQAAGDQRDAVVGDVSENRHLGGGLVVEGRQDDLGTGGLDAQPGEDRDAGTVRQATGYPLDGVREDVALDSNLH